MEEESTEESNCCDSSLSEVETIGNYTRDEDMFDPDFRETGHVHDGDEGEELELSFTEQVILFIILIIQTGTIFISETYRCFIYARIQLTFIFAILTPAGHLS